MIATESLVTHRPYDEDRPSVNGLWSRKYLLFLENITAVFDGFKALDIPSFGIGHRELRVVIGPNGAGKTTMCDVISGKTQPATGHVYYDGACITRVPDAEIALMGIRRKFQTPTVYDSLTAFENMELAIPGRQTVWANLMRRTCASDREKIMDILDRVGLADAVGTYAKNLSHGQRQWLAISTLILADPKLLLVDEPAAGLTDLETELTADLLAALKGSHTLIVIEHDMEFVKRLNSRVTVLNEGRIMDEGMLEDVQQNKEVIEAYLGR